MRAALANPAVLAGLCIFVGTGCDRATAEARSAAPSASVSAAAAPEPKPESLAPCRLLTLDEASVFLSGSATATEWNKLSYSSSCIWEARDPRRGLQVMTSSPAQLAADETLRKIDGNTIEKRYAQVLKSQLAAGTGMPVEGLGDGAIWAKQEEQLWIMKRGRALIAISFHEQKGAPDALEKCEAVADKVLARL